MKLKSIIAAMAAVSLVVPSLAVAQVGTPLTQSDGDAATAGSGFSNASFIVLGLAALSFATIFIVDKDGDNGDRPNSP